MIRIAIAASLVTSVGRAHADPIPDGFVVPTVTMSPDRKLGVTVPDLAHVDDKIASQNQLIELETGRVVMTLPTATVFQHQNHATLAPRWTPDGATLIWYVDGKWSSIDLLVVHFAHGQPVWQTDVETLAEREMLARLRAARPKAWAAAATYFAKDYGPKWTDAITIEVHPMMALAGSDAEGTSLDTGGKPRLPLAITISADSNPKDLDDYPKAALLRGTLTAELDASGKLTFGKLR